MRTSLVVLSALVAATLAAPGASAASSNLAMEMPEGPLGASSVVPVTVTLTMSGFMCHEPREFFVRLMTSATEGVKGTFTTTTLVFRTDARSYFAEPYVQTQRVDLTVRAIQAGEITVAASFSESDAGPCLVPGDFDSATASLTRAVDAPSPTDPTPTTPTEPTPDAPTPPPTRPSGPGACAQQGACGSIGDYDAAIAEGNDTPGFGMLAAVGVVALAALALRRKR